MSEEKDLRTSLNLPQTDFPMKANLPEREPETLVFWEEKKIHEKMLEKNKGREGYVLHDGPPYANGHIHIGHALNKILKDIIVKYKSMNGFYSPYVPGWDCHGLPIELQVDKNLGKEKDSVDILQRRRLCRQYASGFVDIQREEFKRLGVLGDWENPYLTMSYGYEGATVREFTEFVKRGYVYKGKKPVHWCPSCVTALAEAEVEHADKESPSVYVKFQLAAEDAARLGLAGGGSTAYIIIWTTTPWTLPANLALAVNPETDYSVLDEGAGLYITAKDRLPALKEKLSLGGSIVSTLKGKNLRGMRAKHPFIDRLSKIITGEFVTVEEGTGVVHIAPGHGEDDYAAGIKEGLEIYAPVDDRGKFKDAGVPEIEGEFVFKANAKIIDILKTNGALMLEEKISHSYPHCWRCKKPVIFRATEQWFISMSHEGLRERCLTEINSVAWVPPWGRDRIYGMVSSRPDWCISRQRSWGVPITMIKCKGCGEMAAGDAALERFVSLVTESGADVWFEKTEQELLPKGYRCLRCGGDSFVKEKDILDVWFDSGVSQSAVLKADSRLSWPADMYLEGSDQHRGWFQSSLLASCGVTGHAPYKTVLTHGFVVDGKGKKMSKSLGNVVAPQDIIKTSGADILRLWVSAEDYRDDIRISKEIMARISEAYRKIRNTARFLLGNLYDYNEAESGDAALAEIDRWAMSRLQRLIKKVTGAYERFDFHEVFHGMQNFCVVDMSSFYLDILKDRLYTFKAGSPERRASQRVLREVLVAMTKLMAPVMSFTAEEIWRHLKAKEESVFLSDFPKVDERFLDDGLEEKWKRLIAVRDEVNKALELKRAEKFIGNSLEARVLLYLSSDDAGFLQGYMDFLPALFIVSQAEIKNREEGVPEGAYQGQNISVSVERAEGGKCLRCWNWSATVGSFADAPTVCDRCYGVVK
ncbi:MAG: isoleucine--tRNA ligase [Thermodesulfovibrionales bacterium]|nr:isoleucine--tRNA ligase [Thermodesulfovibrionales bacterium]